ncbi:MAG: hypothetical protein ACQERB_12535 [Promethearchaeati archaeon]
MAIQFNGKFKNYKMLKCLICGDRDKISLKKIVIPFSLKHSFLKAFIKCVKEQKEITIPLCQNCQKKVSRWNSLRLISEYLIFVFISLNLVSLFISFLVFAFNLRIPYYIFILLLIAVISLMVSLGIYYKIKSSDYKPSNYVKIDNENLESHILVKPLHKETWIPYKVWLGTSYLEGIENQD